MPYDPTKPANNAPIVSAELRNQFAGLNELIDTRAPRVNNIDPLGIILPQVYDHAELQLIADKLDELIAKLQLP